tara:strand:+ start:2306 stop:3835 length:1530 start_codon:yes stop_codon:yes gene_type:complete
MIPNATLILGPPGCGKTYSLIERVESKLQEGVHPSRIGVVSFTTKAIGEFVDRACTKFNLTKNDFPHFRTLHATGYHGLGLERGDVMSREDYKVLGSLLGVAFDGADATSIDDGMSIPSMGGSGAKYLQLIMRAVYRERTLDYEYNYEGDYSLNFAKLQQISKQLGEYKVKKNKVDFTDMISSYVDISETPYLDLLIVDEAQDLTPLQWTMVEKMAATATEVLIAGDDDQAIHRWTGVDIRRFVGSTDRTEVLNQSYRLPRSVWELSMRISNRIPGRLEKEFFPKDEEGSVRTVGAIWHLPLHRGSWTIQARINKYVNDVAEQLEADGYFYSRKGRWSVNQKKVEAMAVWRDVSEGQAIGVGRIRKLYEAVPKMGMYAAVSRGATKLLDAAGPEDLLTYELLVSEFGLLAAKDTHPMDVIKMSEEEKIYIRAIERRGENIYQEPRIKISTIHAMKGGEDDNVAVYLGSTKNCVEGKHPEDEHRVFYVAITRAKQNLYLIESDKSYRYEI